MFLAYSSAWSIVLCDLHTAALAPTAGVDLRLDDHAGRAIGKEPFADIDSLVQRVRDFAARNRHPVLRQNIFCLVLVNFHSSQLA